MRTNKWEQCATQLFLTLLFWSARQNFHVKPRRRSCRVILHCNSPASDTRHDTPQWFKLVAEMPWKLEAPNSKDAKSKLPQAYRINFGPLHNQQNKKWKHNRCMFHTQKCLQTAELKTEKPNSEAWTSHQMAVMNQNTTSSNPVTVGYNSDGQSKDEKQVQATNKHCTQTGSSSTQSWRRRSNTKI